MNSPPEPVSPATSTPSSGSPAPEEINFHPAENQAPSASFTSGLDRLLGNIIPGAKRRLPAGGSMSSTSARDPKSRKREDPRKFGGSSGPSWSEAPKREKDDLVDQNVVEHLRKQLGDPFLE
ncbi:hypothetical protein ONZ45_g1049 [Pleurotus djamor]|nr:hypothetical protein ONZ45_g1049 [Pleurotus djamor]